MRKRARRGPWPVAFIILPLALVLAAVLCLTYPLQTRFGIGNIGDIHKYLQEHISKPAQALPVQQVKCPLAVTLVRAEVAFVCR